MLRKNFEGRRAQRRAEAVARQEAFEKLSNDEKNARNNNKRKRYPRRVGS